MSNELAGDEDHVEAMETPQEESEQEVASSKEKKSMLSMLAEVASATLTTPDAENEATTAQLSIDQLKALKPAQLLELFAVRTAEDAKKRYSYSCKMQHCNAVFTSHGTETKARQQMTSHLTEHLEEIKRNVGEEGEHCIIETVDYEVEEQTHDGHEEGQVVENMEVVEEIVETVEGGVQVVCHEEGEEQVLEAVYEVEEHSEGQVVEGHEEVHEEQEAVETTIYETIPRKRRHSASSGTMSASEQEDDAPEVINMDDGEVLFRPRRPMNPCEQGAQDWSQLDQMLDHSYTHPCGPPEQPRMKLPTLRVQIDEAGENSLSQEHSSKQARLTIPTALWPSVYIPLLPNMSQIEEVNVDPPTPPAPAATQARIIQPVRTQYIIQGNTVTHQMPAPLHQQKVQQMPQVIHVPPRTSLVSTMSTPTSTSIRPIRVQQTASSSPIVVTSTSTPVASSHTSTSTTQATVTKTPRNRVMFEDENGILYEYEGLLDESEDLRSMSESTGDVSLGQQGTMHIVVDPETGQEYAVEYQTEADGMASGHYEEVAGSSNQKYDIQMVEDSIDEGGVVVYEESGEMVDCADGDGSTVVEWAEEDVAEQEVSTNFSPFEGKIIYHTPPSSDNTPKMVRTKGTNGRPGRNLRLTINQIHDEQMQAVSALVDGNESPQTFKMHNGRVIPGWERQMALSCLKALSERTEPDFVLQCKICNNNKTFTAAATLISHYRSHAGIKPFTCSTCNATFTRQHSLKYHMLIHNNASRFTCTECNRQFRHPSHFKEHLRRHTGETPFECVDCGQRFKTRNTFKRHLKTRHNKLLSKEGIAELALEYADGEDVSEMVVIEEGYEEQEIA